MVTYCENITIEGHMFKDHLLKKITYQNKVRNARLEFSILIMKLARFAR